MEPMPGLPARSLWQATATAARPARSEANDLGDADVVIVGAGYTGLWTALSLVLAEPTARVCVLERHHVGFGASGRNGGWCSGMLPIGLSRLARMHGRDGAIALQRALFGAVDAGRRVRRSRRSGDWHRRAVPPTVAH